MTNSTNQGNTLVKDLQVQVKSLESDLRERSNDSTNEWGQQLKTEYETARAKGRTGLTWSEWRDGEVALAAVAWVLATVFIRFCEDNDLIDGPWITGEGSRYTQAADNETAFYQSQPNANQRDWLKQGFTALAGLPAGRALLDKHNLVWRADISADAAAKLLNFWRKQNDDGLLAHDLTDNTRDTRFLGDLYQDLSDFAKKKYALLQTPVFIEEFILDRTLTPAINEFGLDELKLIDPTCGSGHFLLGSFERLNELWKQREPGADPRVRVQKALDSIYGVDLNPFAVAIAKFRLTVIALEAAGITRIKDAPAFTYHLVVGDSLLYGHSGVQGDLLSDEEFNYANEDIADEPHILDRGRYHVVVGNPPYITVKDRALNDAYRMAYRTCHRQYALSVPFMELFFELAKKGDSSTAAGYVGQITSNSFMKREFGSKIIESLLSGIDLANPVDLTNVIDTSGAYIPGHGTPTVILIGRRRRPIGTTLRAVLGVRGEPGQPQDPARGLVWSEITDHLDETSFNGDYVTVTDLDRTELQSHPWSLSGGGAATLKSRLESSAKRLSDVIQEVGFVAITRADQAYFAPKGTWRRFGVNVRHCVEMVEGESIRDFSLTHSTDALFPYDERLVPDEDESVCRILWLNKQDLIRRREPNGSQLEIGLTWYEWSRFLRPRYQSAFLLAFASVATHNHFVLDRGGKVFKQSSPVIKLPEGATEEEYLDLLGVLNSSTACFWLKQVSHNKGDSTDTHGARVTGDPAFDTYDFTGTKLQEFPLPAVLPRERVRMLDSLAAESAATMPSAVIAQGAVSAKTLSAARDAWLVLRAQMVFQQEELDWEVYRSYGLIDEDLTYTGSSIDGIVLGERAFEIALARSIRDGSQSSSWFERHGSTPVLDLPAMWPEDYRMLVEQRLSLISSDPFIGMLERPEFKRRWASQSWDAMQAPALTSFILDRLEESSLWSDPSGPGVLSVAQLADRVRGDTALVEAARLLRGAVEVDLTAELGQLFAGEAVPFLAAQRCKESGLVKRAEWESVWDLQRREDAGEKVSIPVPPKYKPTDFRKTSFWQARGKLDVPKERFIAYPGAARLGDSSMVIGWAGWDHLERARALARSIAERTGADGISQEALLPLVAGLVELEPWLHQWHAESVPEFGGSPAVFMTGFIDQQLTSLGKTRPDCKAWRP